MPDGSVEALFVGDRDGVNEVIEWCRASQPYARVDEVNVRWLDEAEKMKLEKSDAFIVRY